MFQVEDDFNFDDEILDVTVNESDVSSKFNDGQNDKVFQKSETHVKRTNGDPDFFDSVKLPRNSDGDREFLNVWETPKESNFSNTSFTFPNNSKLNTVLVKKTVRQRKFPGPAGLLPERLGNTSLVATEEFLDELNSENDEPSNFKEKEILSQSSERVFETGAWDVMMKDLGASGRGLISLMNLASLRLKHTRGYKVPFLAVIINNIDCTLPDPTVIVKDVTDEMHGMLHREVWEKFNSEMTPGSVLVLKNVGVISAGTTSRRHVLNITANNLTAIYSNRQEEQIQVRKISELPTGDNSRMLSEWEQIISPVISDNSPRSESLNSDKYVREKVNHRKLHPNRPASCSTPISHHKTSFIRNKSFKEQQPKLNSFSGNKSVNEHPFKRHKMNELNRPAVNNVARPPKKQTVQNNPFQVDTDTSLVDSLLDGIDTNSLFEEF